MDGGYSIINNDSTKRKEEVLGAIERLKGSLIDEGKTLEYYRKERLSVYDTSSACSVESQKEAERT